MMTSRYTVNILLTTKVLFLVIFRLFPSTGQTYDTISNWDGITQNWYVSTGGSAVVPNPAPDQVNPSGHCLKFITGTGMYDYMIYDMAEPANFDAFPRYRLKVLAPLSGGKITLKFENHNNTYSHEIVKMATPGQWADIEYDFSGLFYDDLTRMVIFPDFQGTTPGLNWYIDDVLKEISDPLALESNLPIVVINTFGVPIPDEPKITGHMGIINNGPGMLNNLNDPFTDYDGAIGIEVRGQSTQMFPKKAYAFETRDAQGENLNVSLLGMPEENDWVLYAPYTDKSMLRNVVTFEMGRRMGHYCTRTAFCEVIVNCDYKGVYVMMEKIKKDKNRVDIATLNPDEVSGDDLTGGYILRVDKLDWDFTFGIDGWRSNPVPPYPNAMDIIFQYYYPKSDEIADQQRAYIRDFITVAENTLTGSKFKDPDKGYQQYFDVLSFIDFMLLSEISKEVDKYRYSNYFYKEKDSDGGKLFAGPAWDFNLGYGNVDYWPPGVDHTGWLYQMVEPYEYSIIFWWKRLMEDTWFRDLAKTRWAWLRQNQLTTASIQAVIDSILVYIDAAKDRNYQRWPILGQYVWPNYDWQYNTYEDEVDYFEDFLFSRLLWMDYNFQGDFLHPWAGISSDTNRIHVALYGDYFRQKNLMKQHFRLNDAPVGLNIQAITYMNARECQLTLTADVSGHPEISLTINASAVNYWKDITTNALGSAGLEETPVAPDHFGIFVENNRLHVRTAQPEQLPAQAEIFNLAGQRMGLYTLGRKAENILPLQLHPGFYLLAIRSDHATVVFKFAVVQ